MKDFINPINDKDVQRIYDLLEETITYNAQIKLYGHYKNYLMYDKYNNLEYPLNEIQAENVLSHIIYDNHLTFVQNEFLDEYTQFYTLGQFRKMFSKAIKQFINNKSEELNAFDE